MKTQSDIPNQAFTQPAGGRGSAERLGRAGVAGPSGTVRATGTETAMGRTERREFAVPPATGEFDGIDLSLLNRDDPDERRILIQAEHPELADALDRDVETVTVDGQELNPRLHITMHEVVANQLWDDQPPEVWQTAQRLTALGYGRHEVLHMLASAMSGEVWQALRRGRPYDHDRYVATLDALPESWEAARPGDHYPAGGATSREAVATGQADADWEQAATAVAATAEALVRDARRVRGGVEALAEHPDIAPALAELEPDEDERVLLLRDLVEERDDLAYLHDWDLVYLPDVLDGVVLTHEVSEDELAAGRLSLGPDLDLLLRLVDDEEALAGGGTLRIQGEPADGVHSWWLTGPDGWLDGVQAGEPVALRWTGGTIERLITPPDDTASARAARVLGEVYAGMSTETTELGDLVAEARVDHPDLLSVPCAPLPVLVGQAGLSSHGDFVGPAGFDWRAWRRERTLGLLAMLGQDRHGLGPDAAEAFALVALLVEAAREGGEVPEEVPRHLGDLAGAPGVADALAREFLYLRDPPAEPALRAIAERLLGAGSEPAPLRYLLSACADRRGDTAAAERLVNDAVRDDGTFRPALVEAAWYAGDRGRAAVAAELCARAGIEPGAALRAVPERFAGPGPAAARRNDRCPCGSGRKHKACCEPHNGWPLVHRATWLQHKAIVFALRPAFHEELRRWGELRAEIAGYATADDWFDDPLVHDALLFEDGLMGRFVEERGGLLPGDERAVARGWAGDVPHALYEVQRRSVEAVTVRDAIDGTEWEMVDRERLLRPGTVALTRPLPVGDEWHPFAGTVVVPDRLVDRVADLVDAGRFAELVTTLPAAV